MHKRTIDVALSADLNGSAYRKPDNPPAYINNCSNYPATVIKQLLKLISKRLFEKTKPAYRDPLNKSEFQKKLI